MYIERERETHTVHIHIYIYIHTLFIYTHTCCEANAPLLRLSRTAFVSAARDDVSVDGNASTSYVDDVHTHTHMLLPRVARFMSRVTHAAHNSIITCY